MSSKGTGSTVTVVEDCRDVVHEGISTAWDGWEDAVLHFFGCDVTVFVAGL